MEVILLISNSFTIDDKRTFDAKITLLFVTAIAPAFESELQDVTFNIFSSGDKLLIITLIDYLGNIIDYPIYVPFFNNSFASILSIYLNCL